MKRRAIVFFTAASASLFVMLTCLAALLKAAASETDVFFEAVMALLIGGFLTGLTVLWGLRRHRRAVREETISETREVLSDVIKNRLTVAMLRLQKYQRQQDRTSLEQAKAKLKETAAWIDSFSGATFEEWQDRYEEATPGKGETTRPERPDDRRWMLRWLVQEKPFRQGQQGLS